MNYTPGKVRFLLQSYQSLAQGARISPREDRLGTRPPPLDEAPFCSSSRQKSDIEMALKSIGIERALLLLMYFGMYETSISNGIKRYNWREKVGDWFGLTGGGVHKAVKESLQEMSDTLNGTTVDSSPVPAVV